jgi:hypothetical protein
MVTFHESDRVVVIVDNVLRHGFIKNMASAHDVPIFLVQFDEGDLAKVALPVLAHEPVNEVTAEETNDKEAFTVMLGALAVVDKIVSTVCAPMPYDEVENA